jgi:hypothetical protein
MEQDESPDLGQSRLAILSLLSQGTYFFLADFFVPDFFLTAFFFTDTDYHLRSNKIFVLCLGCFVVAEA